MISRRSVSLLLLVSYAALVALHLCLSRHVTAPILYADGMGYLANARVLAGVGSVPQLVSPFYHFGYSLFLVPAYWLFATPEDVHQASLVINAILASIHLPILYWVGRSLFELEAPDAGLAALATSLYPSFLLQSGLIWTESVVPVLFTSWIALALLAGRRGGIGVVSAFALLGAFTYTVHARCLALVPLTGLFLAWLRYRRRIGSPLLIGAVGVLLLAYLLTEVVNDRLYRAIWSWQPGMESPRRMPLLQLIASRVVNPQLAMTLVGQLWYLLCATAGLALPGVAVLFTMVRRGCRRRAGKSISDPSASAALAILGVLGVLGASCLYLAKGARPDHFIYGRYNEAVLGPLLLAGFSAVLQSRRASHILLQLAVAGVTVVVLTSALLLALPEAFPGPLGMPLTVLGLVVFEPEYVYGSAPLFRPHAVAAGALLLLFTFAIVAVLRRRIAVALLACFFVFAAIDVEPRAIRPLANWAEELLSLHEVVRKIGIEGDIAYDRSHNSTLGLNGYQFFLPNHRFKVFRSRVEEPPAELVITSRTWSKAAALGARRLASETSLDQALWWVPRAPPDHGGADENGG